MKKLFVLYRRNIVFFRVIFILSFNFSNNVKAHDTNIIAVHTSEFFYNISEDEKGKVYIGSSNGLYQISNNSLQRINEEPGYVQFSESRIVRKDNLAIETNRKFTNLLPANYWGYPQQSFEFNKYIYIICKGSLFVYEITDYTTQMPNHSVRCFTENSVGTYSGIYVYGNKIELPTYTSGNILEKDSTFYICYDGLAVYDKKGDTKLYVRSTNGEAQIGGQAIGFAREIVSLQSGEFVMMSTKGVYLIDSSFTQAQTIYTTLDNKSPICINLIDLAHNQVVEFASDKKLYRYSLQQEELFLLKNFEESIEDGFKIENKIKSEYVILTRSHVIIYNYNQNFKVKQAGINQAHSAIPFGVDSVLISSQNGLYFFTLQTKEVSPVVLGGIEFNKRALWESQNIVKLGTTNGFMLFNKQELRELAQMQILGLDKEQEGSSFFYYWLSISLIILMLVVVFIWNKKPFKSEAIAVKEVTMIEIEDYIFSNLNQVTINNIKTHFDLSNKHLYKLAAPKKPGSIISDYRKMKAKELFADGESLKNISEITGFSMSYLKKIK